MLTFKYKYSAKMCWWNVKKKTFDIYAYKLSIQRDESTFRN